MSKTIKIAALGLAAFGAVGAPALGASAAVTGSPIYDTVTTTINGSCTFSGGANNTVVSLTSYAGSQTDSNAFTIVCNTTGGWNVKALGVDAATGSPSARTTMVNGTDSSYTIPAADAGSDGWGFSIAQTGDGTITDGYTAQKAIPGESTLILKGDTTASTTFTPTYYVKVPANQAAGTYTGYVQYTLTDGAQS